MNQKGTHVTADGTVTRPCPACGVRCDREVLPPVRPGGPEWHGWWCPNPDCPVGFDHGYELEEIAARWYAAPVQERLP